MQATSLITVGVKGTISFPHLVHVTAYSCMYVASEPCVHVSWNCLSQSSSGAAVCVNHMEACVNLLHKFSCF